MEFVKTPTFWCPHVYCAACTNFSPRTVELRLSESWEIFPFPFPLSPFPFSFLYELFFFLFSLFSFLIFSFLSFFSFIISFPLSFSLLLWYFSPIWMVIDRMGQEEEVSFSFPQAKCVALKFPSLFLISLFPFYDIITHMAQCEPWDSFPTHG